MSESIYYECRSVRVEVQRCSSDTWFWFSGRESRVRDGYEYNGLHETLEDCLVDAAVELLELDDEWAVSKDQRTPVRT